MAKIKVFIDAGHNPTNPNAGAEGNGLREQDITYEVARIAADLFNANPDYEARLSRETPDVVLGTTNATSLRARVDAANEWGADYFISVHTNASSFANASGCESYVYALDTPAYDLGLLIAEQISAITGIEDRGTFARPSLYVLRKTRMPAVLSEIGFITNAGDAALMSGSPELFAEGIYNGVVLFNS